MNRFKYIELMAHRHSVESSEYKDIISSTYDAIASALRHVKMIPCDLAIQIQEALQSGPMPDLQLKSLMGMVDMKLEGGGPQQPWHE